MQFKNILVPVDFSKCSILALKVAIGIAKLTQSKLHLVNAVHIHAPQPDLIGGSLMESVISDYESQVKESYAELEKEVVELKDVPHENDQFLAYLTDAIFAEVENKKIDMIIMGTRENHETIEHLTGTNTSDVIEMASCPVLVIPENVKTFQPKIIGFASDLNTLKDFKKLSLIQQFANLYQASVMVFHISDEPEKLTAKHQQIIEKTKAALGDIECSVRTVESKSVIDGINEFALKHSLDLLVMMPRKYNLFTRLFRKSITKRLAIDSKIPLLTFQDS